MVYNEIELDVRELYDLLGQIETKLDNPINLYALGVTALTILNIKNSTRDVDFNIETKKHYQIFIRTLEDLGFESKNNNIRWVSQEGIAFDLFYGSNILGTDLLPDCLSKSRFIKKIGKVSIYTLSFEDIIISKLARSDERDLEDIKTIFENEKIDIQYLTRRYKSTMDISIVFGYNEKYVLFLKDLEKIGISIKKEIFEEIKRWD